MSRWRGEEHHRKKAIRQLVKSHMVKSVTAELENVLLNGEHVSSLPPLSFDAELLILKIDHPSSWWKVKR